MLASVVTLATHALCFAPRARAHEGQQGPDDAELRESPRGRTEMAALPVLGASSDTGFAFGAYLRLTGVKPAPEPFDWQFSALFQISVKDGPDGAEFPLHDDFIAFEKTGLLGGKLRLRGKLAFQQNIIAGWYGLGNASRAQRDGNPRRFQFKLRQPVARTFARLALWSRLSAFGAVDFRHTAIGIYGGSKLAQDIAASRDGSGERIYGYGAHALGTLQGGLLWDSRDDEVSPTQGNFHELSLRGSPGELTGAEHDFVGIGAVARSFHALAGEYLVLALRVSSDLLIGKVPFYLLGTTGDTMGGTGGAEALGGISGVRGVPSRRYNGKAKLIGNVELRSTLLRFRTAGDDFALAASAFFDAGRVWLELDSGAALDGRGVGLKYGTGGGPLLLWGTATAIRFDLAYSPDATPLGFYIDVFRAF